MKMDNHLVNLVTRANDAADESVQLHHSINPNNSGHANYSQSMGSVDLKLLLFSKMQGDVGR